MISTLDCLDHDHLASKEDQKSWTCFCRLDYEDQESKIGSSIQFEATTCHFIRMGWLVEQDMRTKSRSTTNYVLLLNVTTKPASLWLAFDYVWFDDEGNDQLRTLTDNYGDVEYYAWYYGRPNLLKDDSPSPEDDTSSYKPRSSDEDDESVLGIRKSFDLAMISRDIREDWKGRVLAGLEREKMQACINENSCVLGDTKPQGYSEQ